MSPTADTDDLDVYSAEIEEMDDATLRRLFKPDGMTQNKGSYPQPDWDYIQVLFKPKS